MHPDLERTASEFTEAGARLHRLAETVDSSGWSRRPAAGGWSIDECVAHLILTNERYIPVLVDAIDAAPVMSEPPAPLRQDLAGRLLRWMMEPPVRFKLPTSPPFQPPSSAGRSATLARFEAVQARLTDLIREMDGLDVSRVRIASPFNARLRYSAYSALCIIVAHERRHLWQAERVRDANRRAPG
ncbi:MAG TPA: DinB family protein [Gemmatimonadales bacterium]|nr:DinB family protein [Gemmatimonadales bacterium]